MNKCAFDREDHCTALNAKQCKGCHFYKTEYELKEGRQKALDRLSSLPKSKQIRIARKYYDIEMK